MSIIRRSVRSPEISNVSAGQLYWLPHHAAGATSTVTPLVSTVTGISSADVSTTTALTYGAYDGMASSAGTAIVIDRTQAMADFASLDTALYQMVMGIRARYAATPTGQFIMSGGWIPGSTSYGGYGIEWDNASTGNIKWQPTGGSTSNACSLPNISVNQIFNVVVCFDVQHAAFATYKNGSVGPSAAMPGPAPKVRALAGVSFWGRSTNAGGTANLVPSGFAMGDIWMLKSNKDVSGAIGQIAADWNKYPMHLQTILEQL